MRVRRQWRGGRKVRPAQDLWGSVRMRGARVRAGRKNISPARRGARDRQDAPGSAPGVADG